MGNEKTSRGDIKGTGVNVAILFFITEKKFP